MDENLDFYNKENTSNSEEKLVKVTGMYKDWFLDYASYVILERAIPDVFDGLKPVQRRILHSMKELDDGRFNKVANIVGHTMQFHPHGDASISDAIVQVGQKDLLIETQGNWGNILTGDKAAASRYIEARLSKFALEVIFSPKITEWQLSYDGRKKEPIHLPVKFPLLLEQGAEGIAVGLSTKILPHNFKELIKASVSYLKGKKFRIFPDFQTGGIMDVQNYNDGERGGKIKVRARISLKDKNTLIITEIPFGTTTTSLIESILKANDKGKIKIKKIEDNTSSEVEILIYLPPGISPDKTIDALYAFTSCETSVSPQGCVIVNNKPSFMGITDILKNSTDNTVELLKKELNVKLKDLENLWRFSTLERIFIEKKIYRDIEKENTWEGVIDAIRNGLIPFESQIKHEINNDDILKLTEIRIKKISRFDLNKAIEKINQIEESISTVKNNLKNLINYSITYFERLLGDYGKDKDRRTEIRVFDNVDATKVVTRNLKLYVNREEGFIGTSLRKNEYVCDCSDIDDIIVFTNSGKMKVVRVDSKIFIEKEIGYVAVFKKKDFRTIYNLIYKDGKSKISYIKRFAVTGITRDKIYDITQGSPGSLVLHFSANSNGEAEKVRYYIKKSKSTESLRKRDYDEDFSRYQIKSRSARGNILSKHNLLKVEFKEKGLSTLKPRNVWFDPIVLKLNLDSRGNPLGAFRAEDLLLIINEDGTLKTTTPEPSTQFKGLPIVIERWIKGKPITLVYYDENKKEYFIKRFLIENQNKELNYLKEDVKFVFITTEWRPVINIYFKKNKGEELNQEKKINVEEFIDIKGFKASGNRLLTEKKYSKRKINKISLIESLPYEDSTQNRVVSEFEVNEPDELSKLDKIQTKLKF
ncbi:MAG: DNA gyrase/topoisomerase IV subunit A [Flavobacteriaceae bacterium]|tara:strand:+ start:8686 stop:11307 length:2622 start_codon:yes stop_codon:yes gene_type:complete